MVNGRRAICQLWVKQHTLFTYCKICREQFLLQLCSSWQVFKWHSVARSLCNNGDGASCLCCYCICVCVRKSKYPANIVICQERSTMSGCRKRLIYTPMFSLTRILSEISSDINTFKQNFYTIKNNSNYSNRHKNYWSNLYYFKDCRKTSFQFAWIKTENTCFLSIGDTCHSLY